MATSRLRPPEVLAAGFGRWLAGHPEVAAGGVAGVAHASAGWANETVVVDLEGGDRLVLRLPAAAPTFPAYDLSLQAAVHRAVAAAGVPAPVPVTVEDDPSWLGAPFMVMPFVAGHIPEQIPAFDRWITGAPLDEQARLLNRFVDLLAAVHAVDWAAAGLGDVLRGRGGVAGELAWWEDYLVWAADGEPMAVLVEAAAWCRERLPPDPPSPSLLWGDPRLGNVVFDDDRQVVAVLDWELAVLGPGEVDLGWYLAQDRVMGELIGRTVPGFYDRRAFVDRYQQASGRTVADLGWYEVFGLFRSLAVDNRQARLAARAGVPYLTPPDETNPLAGVLRRLMAA